MLTFKRTAIDEYTLFDGETETLARATVDGNRIKNVEYFTERARLAYADFTMRSLAFVLRNSYPEIVCNFYDRYLEAIGFKRDGEGMRATALEINFDTCSCHGGNNEN